MRRCALLSILSLCGALALGGIKAGPTHAEPRESFPEASPLMPDAAVQQLLQRFARVGDVAGTADFYRALADLAEHVQGGKDGDALVRQILIHAAYGPPPDERRFTYLGMLLNEELMAPMSVYRKGVCKTVAPYMSSDDGRLRGAAAALFSMAGGYVPEHAYNRKSKFSVIEAYLGTLPRLEEPPRQMVQSMYGAHPHAAVRTMQFVYMRREDGEGWRALSSKVSLIERHLLDAPTGPDAVEVPPDVKQALDQFSRSEHWWVRLYVASLMRRHDELRDNDILRRLTNDAEQLVRENVKLSK